MKTKHGICAVLALALAFPLAAMSQTRVGGYVTKNGTYVAPHYRSSPNSTKLDNYSTRGNVNPYTGQAGTNDPYATPTYKPYVAPAPRANPYQPRPKKSNGWNDGQP
jgi:hypothetical protein